MMKKKKNGEVESELTGLKDSRSSAAKDIEQQKDELKKREADFKQKLDEQKAYIDKLEKDFTTFKASAGAETEAKMQALQGQVALLRQLGDELKAEKREWLSRDQQSREWLRDAASQIGELKSELKNVEAAHGTELEKVRLQLEASRERYVADSRGWASQQEEMEAKLIKQSALIQSKSAALTDAQEEASSSSSSLKQKEAFFREEMKRLRELVEQLQTDKQEYAEKEISYESRLGQISASLIDARSKLVESDHSREFAVIEARSEKDVLEAKLEAEKKALLELSANFEKELKMHQARFAREIARLNAVHEGDMHHHQQQSISQADSYKYKLQYLELLNAEHKKTKEREKRDRRYGGEKKQEVSAEPQPIVASPAPVEPKESAPSPPPPAAVSAAEEPPKDGGEADF